jgi:LmbE family N-acetylglucosaminyl deacetylase
MLGGPAHAEAQAPRQLGAGELLRRIERLGVVGTVLYIAAHPDDENPRLLAYLSGERRLRTAYLSLTRGDGGQNLIGAEQGPLLGVIRTQELLAARGIDGAEQYFTRARDFGYSKTPDETLAIWGRDAVLADVVWVIRRVQPDVIITRFPPQGLETHGQHTASALLAEEAFRRAADPQFHPEQLRFVGVWQARRLLWNKSLWAAKPGEDLSRFLSLDTGVYDPISGVSAAELAGASRSMHKSQGFGAAPTHGPALEYFEPRLGDRPRQAVFEGLDLTWGRVRGAAPLAALIREAQRQFDPRRPAASIAPLLMVRAELARLPDNPWKDQKLREVTDVIIGCAGLYLEVTADDFSVVPGGSLALSAVAINRSPASVRLDEVRLPGGVVVKVGRPLPPNQPVVTERRVTVPRETAYSSPYWLDAPPEKGLYPTADQQLIGLPESPPRLVAEYVLRVGEHPLLVHRPVVYKWTDPVMGERYRAIEIAPPVSLNPETPVLMFPDRQPRSLRVVLKAGVDGAAGTVSLDVPAGFTAQPKRAAFRLGAKGAEDEVRFVIQPPAGAAHGTLRVTADVAGVRVSRGLLRIDHPHIPIQTLFPPAEVTLTRFALKRSRPKLGYLAGAGDEVPEALRQVGYDVTLLDDAALAHGALSVLGAIVVGVRAYNTNPRLAFHHRRLMDYVAGGGTLIVQYNTNNRLTKLSAPIGPYPFEISQERVTDEDAAVTFTAPAHPLLARPNRITAADFDGWTQERGLYFAAKWSPKYETVLSMHDPGEPARLGSLLVARHGKGAFIYTGLAFFRQLPAGVPGAYRLFANLIAYAPPR